MMKRLLCALVMGGLLGAASGCSESKAPVIEKPKEQQLAELARIVKEREEKQQAAKAEREAAKAGTQPATKSRASSRANQAMKDVDEFCKKWKAFDNNQRRAFVNIFKDELAALLDAIQQQEAMIGAAA